MSIQNDERGLGLLSELATIRTLQQLIIVRRSVEWDGNHFLLELGNDYGCR